MSYQVGDLVRVRHVLPQERGKSLNEVRRQGLLVVGNLK